MAVDGKTCGECGACCTLAEIKPLNKPAHVTCVHYVAAKGCGIYADRPAPCIAFECGYLQNAALGEEWRPDRAGFVLYFAPGPHLIAETDLATPDAWRREPYISQLREWSRRDQPNTMMVVARTGKHLTVIFPEAEIEIGEDTGLQISSGYRTVGDRRIPYAEFAKPSGWAL